MVHESISHTPSYAADKKSLDVLSLPLTATERFQLLKFCYNPDEEAQKNAISIFQHVPEQQKGIVQNPFSFIKNPDPHSLQRNEGFYKLARSAILAEPPSVYDEEFSELNPEQQEIARYRQVDISAEASARLDTYLLDNVEDFNNLNDKELYNALTLTLFETDDLEIINAEHSLLQRRYFRLSALNVIEQRNQLLLHKEYASRDPKAFLEDRLTLQLTETPRYKETPLGLAFYMNQEDFSRAYGTPSHSVAASAFLVTGQPLLPPELKSHIICIATTSSDNEAVPIQSQERSLSHELSHASFATFHQREESISGYTIADRCYATSNPKEYKQLSSGIFNSLMQGAQNELVAYFHEPSFSPTLSSLALKRQPLLVGILHSSIRSNSDLSSEEQDELHAHLDGQANSTFYYIQAARLIVKDFQQKVQEGALSQQKAMALLSMTPLNQYHYLASYIDKDPSDLENLPKTLFNKDFDRLSMIQDFTSIPSSYDPQTFSDFCAFFDTFDSTEDFGPCESPLIVSGSLDLLDTWEDDTASEYFYVNTVLVGLKNVLQYSSPTEEDRLRLRQYISTMVSSKFSSPDLKGWPETEQLLFDLFDIIQSP